MGEIVHAIRGRVGRSFHLQAKISAIDYNNVLPFEKPGNTLEEAIQTAIVTRFAGETREPYSSVLSGLT